MPEPQWTDEEASEFASALAADIDNGESTSHWRMDRDFLRWAAQRFADIALPAAPLAMDGTTADGAFTFKLIPENNAFRPDAASHVTPSELLAIANAQVAEIESLRVALTEARRERDKARAEAQYPDSLDGSILAEAATMLDDFKGWQNPGSVASLEEMILAIRRVSRWISAASRSPSDQGER